MAILDRIRLTRSAALALLAAIALPAAAAAETAIHFTLDRKIDGPAAPLFLAVDRGYFKAEGLDVTIDAAAGALEPVTRLASGSYDMGVADLNVLIKFRDDNPHATDPGTGRMRPWSKFRCGLPTIWVPRAEADNAADHHDSNSRPGTSRKSPAFSVTSVAR